MGLGQGNTPNDKNKPENGKKKGDGAGNGEPPSLEGGSMPDLGAPIAAGSYIAKHDKDGPVKAGGKAVLYENALVLGPAEISGSMIQDLGIQGPDDVARALNGDSGTSTSVGYNRKYGESWDRVFSDKPSNN